MKHILVSGCARGIGEAVTRRFLAEGYAVTGMSRTDAATVEAKFNHPNFAYVQGDLASTLSRAHLPVSAVLTVWSMSPGSPPRCGQTCWR